MKILFLGDICTEGFSEENFENFKNNKLYRYLTEFEGTIVGNLEAPLLTDDIIKNKDKISLKNTPSLFKYYDFCDVFNLANNHMFDQGIEGYDKTVAFLEKKGKAYFGSGDSILTARKGHIIDSGSEKIALLSYCCYTANSEHYAKKSSFGVMPLVKEYIEEDISYYENKVDHIIVLPHWGIENCFHPTYDQVGFARDLLDKKVKLVIGTHPHVIHSFEKKNKGSIYYSLGNFMFGDYYISDKQKKYQSKYNKESMLVEVEISGGNIDLKEVYIKQDKRNLPEIVDFKELSTPVSENNRMLEEKTLELQHSKMEPNLGIDLKFNGKSMQLVNKSSIISENSTIRYENLRVKFKRLVMHKLRTLI